QLITSDELAFRLLDKDKNLQIIDMRTPKEFKDMTFPRSKSFTVEGLFEKFADKIINIKKKENVFIANDELTAKKAAIVADKLGFNNIFVLKGGVNEFTKEILNYNPNDVVAHNHNDATKRFRLKASIMIPKLIEESKNSIVPDKKPKRVLGGC
ncbi:MAG: rhodanese-like domain-containing protein, partial [Ignavibacteriaceae bacterium]|nr:rhodanese-like domain-containing protein [Ignavibacteriaceae bacterium]